MNGPLRTSSVRILSVKTGGQSAGSLGGAAALGSDACYVVVTEAEACSSPVLLLVPVSVPEPEPEPEPVPVPVPVLVPVLVPALDGSSVSVLWEAGSVPPLADWLESVLLLRNLSIAPVKYG